MYKTGNLARFEGHTRKLGDSPDFGIGHLAGPARSSLLTGACSGICPKLLIKDMKVSCICTWTHRF